MPGQHVHDSEEARRLEAIYTTPTAAARRRFVRTHLDIAPGESVLSIGCGPGFEPAELADTVGESGHVRGIDVSEAMLSMAEERCAEMPQVTVEPGDAVDLPIEDDAFDAAVAVQVYEYLDDVDVAIAELERILRPGGRAAVYSTDWDSLVWHNSDPTRFQRVVETLTDVYEHPHLGSRLASRFHDASLTIERVEPNSILNTSLKGTFFGCVIDLIRVQLATIDEFDPADIEAWERDLAETEAAGETFFSLTQYLYVVENRDTRR